MNLPTPASRLRVIVTAGGLGEKFGGPSRTITGLVAGLCRQGVDTTLVSGIASAKDGPAVIPEAVKPYLTPIDVHYVGPIRLYPRMAVALTEQATKRPRSACVIHDNGIWGHYNWVVFSEAARLNAPYLLSPRGMLEAWSLRQKRLKKQFAMTLFQRRILIGTTAFVATAESEAESIRRLGLKQPIAIVPNGIELSVESLPQRRAAERPRILLFLSRLHPKKGLPLLITAWSLIQPAGWRLRIAGPDEAGHEAEVRKLIEDLRVQDSVEIVGPVEGAAKRTLFHDADVFILPTYSENFGVVVAEALNAGLPVITTTGAPWGDLQRHGCGWWVEVSVSAIRQAISEATSLSDAERFEMGSRAKGYVAKFGWDHVAQQMNEVYEWATGLRSRPDCVILN